MNPSSKQLVQINCRTLCLWQQQTNYYAKLENQNRTYM